MLFLEFRDVCILYVQQWFNSFDVFWCPDVDARTVSYIWICPCNLPWWLKMSQEVPHIVMKSHPKNFPSNKALDCAALSDNSSTALYLSWQSHLSRFDAHWRQWIHQVWKRDRVRPAAQISLPGWRRNSAAVCRATQRIIKWKYLIGRETKSVPPYLIACRVWGWKCFWGAAIRFARGINFEICALFICEPQQDEDDISRCTLREDIEKSYERWKSPV